MGSGYHDRPQMRTDQNVNICEGKTNPWWHQAEPPELQTEAISLVMRPGCFMLFPEPSILLRYKFMGHRIWRPAKHTALHGKEPGMASSHVDAYAFRNWEEIARSFLKKEWRVACGRWGIRDNSAKTGKEERSHKREGAPLVGGTLYYWLLSS